MDALEGSVVSTVGQPQIKRRPDINLARGIPVLSGNLSTREEETENNRKRVHPHAHILLLLIVCWLV